jgi:putative inorganic carbon (HCO3(-)) transporter
MASATPAPRRDPSMVWFVCMVLYVLLGPTQAPFYTPSLYDNARLLQLLSLSALSFIALAMPSLRKGIMGAASQVRGFVRWNLGFLAALTLASALRAAAPDMALQEIALLALLGLLALSTASLATTNRTLVDRALLAAFEGSALVFVVVFWMAYAATREIGQPFEWIHPFVTFANVRHFSQFQAYTLPLLVIPIASSGLTPRWRVAAYLVAAHWWALQFAVGTRAIWFATALSAVILLLMLRRNAAAFLKWIALAIAGGGIVYLLLNTFVLADAPGLADVGRRGFDASKRGELWASALAMVRDAPILGVGPMHFSFRNFEWAAHPHSTVLQLAAEYGVPAATIATGLVAYLLWSCIGWTKSARDEDDRLITTGLLAALLMGLLDALVSGNTLMPVSQMILFILIGWVIGRNAPARCDSPPLRPRTTAFAISVIAFVCTVTVGHGALSYYRYWDARQFFVPAGPSHPRYWEEGHWPAVNAAGIAVLED